MSEVAMLKTVFQAIQTAKDASEHELQAIPFEGPVPPHDYFASIVHQKLRLVLCGADVETMRGGNARIGAAILENGRKLSTHYWGPNTSDPHATNPVDRIPWATPDWRPSPSYSKGETI